MRKKGETGEQDRGKPQPRKKKDRDDARKKKNSTEQKDNNQNKLRQIIFSANTLVFSVLFLRNMNPRFGAILH